MSLSEKDIIKKVALKTNIADVYSQEHTSLSVSFKANKLDSIESSSASGICLRLAHKNKIGFASIVGGDRDDTSWMIDRAFETSKFGVDAHFKPPAKHSSKTIIDDNDTRLWKPDVALMKEVGAELLSGLRKHDRSLSVDVSVSAGSGRSRTVNTRNVNIENSGTSFSISASINKIRGTDMTDIWEYQSSTHQFTDTNAVKERLINKLEWAKRSAKVKTSSMPVIFTPKGFSDVAMISILPGISGRNIAQRTSPLTNKLGEAVFSKALTLSEEPHLSRQSRSCTFDDEGTLTAPKPLFEKGILKTFVFDLQTAGELGEKSTGNGFRGVGSLPSISFTNLKIKNGKHALSEMISNLDEGVIVDQVMGAWAGNVLGGFISGQIHLGYYVKDGKIVGRIKDAMLSLNIYEALKGKLLISKEQEWTYGGGNLLCPYILVPDITISSNA